MLRPIPWPTSERTTDRPAPSATPWIALERSPMRLPGQHCATPACSDSSAALRRLRTCGGTPPTGGVAGDPAIERDAHVDRDDVALAQAVRAGDAMHDHRVRRGTDGPGEAAV